MTIEELRNEVAKYQDVLASKDGIVKFSPTGPASMRMIDVLVQALEAQDRRIRELEAKLQ